MPDETRWSLPWTYSCRILGILISFLFYQIGCKAEEFRNLDLSSPLYTFSDGWTKGDEAYTTTNGSVMVSFKGTLHPATRMAIELIFLSSYVFRPSPRHFGLDVRPDRCNRHFRSRHHVGQQDHRLKLVPLKILGHPLNFGQTAKVGEGTRMVGRHSLP